MEMTKELSPFKTAVDEQEARTENNMKAYGSTLNSCVDLFYKIGASRGKNITPDFTKAFVENKDLAIRIALWARDVRGGAGERQLFRDILTLLAATDQPTLKAIVPKIPELGRWDDLFYVTGDARNEALTLIKAALENGDGLCAKWMPRKGLNSVHLRNFLKLTPKQYRKMLVGITNVVETPMCSGNWDNIEFGHVPSLAHARYKKAFLKNAPIVYKTYIDGLETGETKINAGAVYPYDVLKTVIGSGRYGVQNFSEAESKQIIAQWAALPDFMNDKNVLPIVDVSGSMSSPVGGGAKKVSLTCMDVAVSLGLYVADKNKGNFKDVFMTFSGSPQIEVLRGNIIEKTLQLSTADWDMNTDLHAAFDKLLEVATKNKVPAEDMPAMLLIMSDMQFDQCVKYDNSAIEMIRIKYEAQGYPMPAVVFWNINAYDNAPVRFNEKGVALVSGFSPTILKSLLAGNLDQITPMNMMLDTITNQRYAWL